jgi:gluconokinase
VSFLFLDGSQSLILERMRARQGHFMREAMVQSQFDTLERPDGEPGVFRIDIDGTFEQVVDRAVTALTQAQ